MVYVNALFARANVQRAVSAPTATTATTTTAPHPLPTIAKPSTTSKPPAPPQGSTRPVSIPPPHPTLHPQPTIVSHPPSTPPPPPQPTAGGSDDKGGSNDGKDNRSNGDGNGNASPPSIPTSPPRPQPPPPAGTSGIPGSIIGTTTGPGTSPPVTVLPVDPGTIPSNMLPTSGTKSMPPQQAMDAADGQTDAPTGEAFPITTAVPQGHSHLGSSEPSVVIKSEVDGTVLSITRTIVTLPSSGADNSAGGSSKQAGFPTWIVGAIIAGTAVLVVITMGFILYRRRRRPFNAKGFQKINGETVHVHSTLLPLTHTDDGHSPSVPGSSAGPRFPLPVSYPTHRMITVSTDVSYPSTPTSASFSASTLYSNSPTSLIMSPVAYPYVAYPPVAYPGHRYHEKAGPLSTVEEDPFEDDEMESVYHNQQRQLDDNPILASYHQVTIEDWIRKTDRGADVQRSLSTDSGVSNETAPPPYRSSQAS